MKNLFQFFFFAGIFFNSFLYITPSSAAEIGKSNKKQAIVILNGDTVEVGKKYFVIDPSTLKKRAQIQIDKITGDKARATILKGKVATGYSLVLKNSGGAESEETEDSEESSAEEGTASKRSLLGIKNSWGLLGSYIMNSMSAKRTSNGISGVTNMTGSTFGLGAFYNFPFSSNMSLKFSAAYEQMGVTGTIASSPGCASSSGTSCEATITYFSGYGHVNYYFSTGKIRPLMGLGLGF
nr:hypothetical protein [Pseudobdellovibrionaceae bacterium]